MKEPSNRSLRKIPIGTTYGKERPFTDFLKECNEAEQDNMKRYEANRMVQGKLEVVHPSVNDGDIERHHAVLARRMCEAMGVDAELIAPPVLWNHDASKTIEGVQAKDGRKDDIENKIAIVGHGGHGIIGLKGRNLGISEFDNIKVFTKGQLAEFGDKMVETIRNLPEGTKVIVVDSIPAEIASPSIPVLPKLDKYDDKEFKTLTSGSGDPQKDFRKFVKSKHKHKRR